MESRYPEFRISRTFRYFELEAVSPGVDLLVYRCNFMLDISHHPVYPTIFDSPQEAQDNGTLLY